MTQEKTQNTLDAAVKPLRPELDMHATRIRYQFPNLRVTVDDAFGRVEVEVLEESNTPRNLAEKALTYIRLSGEGKKYALVGDVDTEVTVDRPFASWLFRDDEGGLSRAELPRGLFPIDTIDYSEIEAIGEHIFASQGDRYCVEHAGNKKFRVYQRSRIPLLGKSRHVSTVEIAYGLPSASLEDIRDINEATRTNILLQELALISGLELNGSFSSSEDSRKFMLPETTGAVMAENPVGWWTPKSGLLHDLKKYSTQ